MGDHISSARFRLVQQLSAVLIALLTIAVCILPMDALPIWNGEIPGHRNQYELMAEAILDGRIEFAYGDEHYLSQLNNPYDPIERRESGVPYHWDHAYYNGHYYMYFGIVPVFLAFLPYRIVTGEAMTTYHATQLFVTFAIAGFFVLFHLLRKRFFPKLPYWVYLALSAAFSVMSIWYSIAEPALYCTAITSAIALEVWSLYFFIRAVWHEQAENRQILFAAIGAALGALAFGCRPPIALANILVIPMLAVFLRQHRFSVKLLGKLLLAALPYALVAAGLMWYNYIRFEDPFEFGQAYQLTVADQSSYSISLNPETLLRIINETVRNLFLPGTITGSFPYVQASSVFYNFPILFLGLVAFVPCVFLRLRRAKLLPLIIGIAVSVLVITAMDVLWTPYLLERYRMDIYFLMGIGCYLVIGCWHRACRAKGRMILNVFLVGLSVATVISAFLLCVDTVGVYYPEKVSEIAAYLHLG